MTGRSNARYLEVMATFIGDDGSSVNNRNLLIMDTFHCIIVYSRDFTFKTETNEYS